ncbi:NAD/NADP-dependent octopine/nopaline dehydrogenase family protein [uncultured Methanobrevibacter sp.]|uniref:NAD/NADP octopine/nopaline dehydrogenase family protein n=1 Tax=uncultured Methanobrevibacter sp. TaxID=253161 RepID=UPI0026146CB0|nr:NAD/NADP-dependent octopine/nopaline dehydrogenase family protein [uncultured Methanobrevibacter sp.]
MNVTIIGGGNIGTLIAAELLNKNYDVCIYTSKVDQWGDSLEVYDVNNKFLFESTGLKVTDNIHNALKTAEIIFITYPAALFHKLSKDMENHVHRGQYIGVVPGSGGAEFLFGNLIAKGCILFGLQRVHSIARLKEYGKSVLMLGRKDGLDIATFPRGFELFVKNLLENMFDLPCNVITNYLAITLTPSNPILHTSRLYSMFNQKQIFDKNILFYEEWDDDSSELMIKCDSQLQDLCDVLRINGVKSLKDHYESYSIKSMTQKIKSIGAFKGLTSPMIQTDNGWIPDFSSRYFTTDFSFGLKVIIDIARIYNVDVSYLEKIWDWYYNLCNPKNYFDLFKLGISSQKDFEKYYYFDG